MTKKAGKPEPIRVRRRELLSIDGCGGAGRAGGAGALLCRRPQGDEHPRRRCQHEPRAVFPWVHYGRTAQSSLRPVCFHCGVLSFSSCLVSLRSFQEQELDDENAAPTHSGPPPLAFGVVTATDAKA